MSRTAKVLGAFVVMLLVATACSSKSTGGGGGGGAFGETKDSTIAAEVPSSVASKGSVTVATDASYAPMEFFKPGSTSVIEGADVDLGKALGAVLGITFNYQNASFDGIIPGLQSGKYDLGFSSFFDTLEREGQVDMIDYFQAGSGIFVLAGNGQNYTSLDQLCGQTVAAESGTTELSDAQAASKVCVRESKKPIKALSFNDQNGVNLAVQSGRALAGLADSEVCRYQVKVTNAQFRFAGEYAAPVLYGMAIPRAKGSRAGTGPMTKAIYDALKKLFSDGTYAKILAKWGIQSGALQMPTINGATS